MQASPVLIQNMAAQGDVLFRRIETLPAGLTAAPESPILVLVPSAEGHNHVIERPKGIATYYPGKDPMLSHMVLTDAATVTHQRQHDTHAPLTLRSGVWEVRRQRESTPEGYRRVED